MLRKTAIFGKYDHEFFHTLDLWFKIFNPSSICHRVLLLVIDTQNSLIEKKNILSGLFIRFVYPVCFPVCLSCLFIRFASPVCFSGLFLWFVSPICFSGLFIRLVYPVSLSGLFIRCVYPVCFSGLFIRFVNPVCLSGLFFRFVYLVCLSGLFSIKVETVEPIEPIFVFALLEHITQFLKIFILILKILK